MKKKTAMKVLHEEYKEKLRQLFPPESPLDFAHFLKSLNSLTAWFDEKFLEHLEEEKKQIIQSNTDGFSEAYMLSSGYFLSAKTGEDYYNQVYETGEDYYNRVYEQGLVDYTKSPIERTMDEVETYLNKAKEHKMDLEIVVWALKAMKDSPGLTIEEAMKRGYDDWIK